jgi:ferredoxin-type protein NapH
LFGWAYPLLGLAVPVVMVLGLTVSPFKGRWVCGNACPRGSFLDTVMSRLTMKRPLPVIFRSSAFKWTVVVVLMGLMMTRLLLSVHALTVIGRLFWVMCAVTSVVAIVLAVVYNHRAWCAMCPMGTIQGALTPRRREK